MNMYLYCSRTSEPELEGQDLIVLGAAHTKNKKSVPATGVFTYEIFI